MLVPDSVGEIRLNRSWIQGAALDGLQDHSHVWVSFLFHNNTNTSRLVDLEGESKEDGQKKKKKKKQQKMFPAKVAPPALGGRRVGVFCTRSPHRPNPVGLTLVRLEGVDTALGVLRVSGLDLVDGTPIIDIKPYCTREWLPAGRVDICNRRASALVRCHACTNTAVGELLCPSAAFDALPDAKCPEWVTSKWTDRTPVEFSDSAVADLEAFFSCMKLYKRLDNGLSRAKNAMEQVRSVLFWR